jgi:DNA transposition AAA+ family ATPase
MVTDVLKKRIVDAVKELGSRYPVDAQKAKFLGISAAVLSRIQKGETDRVLSDGQWIQIARKLEVDIANKPEIKAAETETFQFISKQLAICQTKSIGLLLCDIAGIGKTFSAKHYVKQNKHAIYVDCSQVKSKQKLVRQIAKEFGLSHTGKYADVYDDLTYYIKTLPCPLIVLDEAGDLDYPAFLELKALYNATEDCCGWYMMGADGLKEKIERNLNCKKVGYSEIFRRYGEKYQKIVPDGKEDKEQFLKKQIATVSKANGCENVTELFVKTKGSLTRLKLELLKMKEN